MNRRLLAPALLGIVAVVLPACGDDGPKKLQSNAGSIQVEDGPEIGTYITDGGSVGGGGSGGGGAGGGAAGGSKGKKPGQKVIAGATDYDVVADPDLRLDLTQPSDGYEPGRPIPVRLQLRHVGSRPVRLVEPETDLLSSIEFHVFEQGKVVVRRPAAPKRTGRKIQVVTFEPGDTSEVQIDLYPLVGGTESYLGGRVIVRAVYRGSGWRVAGKHPDVWNADGKNRLVSYELQLVAETPEWLEAQGYDEAASAKVVTMLMRWKLRGTGAENPTEKIRAMGEQGALALANIVTWLDSTDEERAQVGGKALLVARAIGSPVLKVLRKIDGVPHAAQLQALSLLAADQRVRLKEALGPEADLFRNVAGGESEGSTLFVDVPQRGNRKGTTYQIDARGVFTIVHDPRGAKKRHATQLPTPHLVHLKKTLNGARVWTWRPVRKTTLGPAEGFVTIGVQAPGKPPVRIRIPRMEALRDNPVIFQCLEAVMSTGDRLAGLDERETASAPPRLPK